MGTKTQKLVDVTDRVRRNKHGYNLCRCNEKNDTPLSVIQTIVLQQMEFGRWYEAGDFQWKTMNSLVGKQKLIVGRSRRYDQARIEDMLLDAILNSDGSNDPITVYRLATSEDFD